VTRADVEALRVALLYGRVSPEEVRAWADPWVRGTETEPPEWGVNNAIYVLHGLTGTHRWSEIEPTRTQTLRERLDKWKTDCAAYDADPTGFLHRRRLNLLRGLATNNPDKAQAAARILGRIGWLSDADVRAILG
jgi:hypothetical protein